MEKNKQDSQEDIFLRKYVQEIELDKPKANFTSSIMDVILAEEKQTVVNASPLISKKMWLLVVGFIATCLGFLLKERNASTFKFPTIDTNFIPNFEIPNLFGNLSISTTTLFAVITFSVLAFIQIGYLKNYFNKQFES